MTVELVISVVGLLFGSGGLVMIFMAGRRTGSLETTLAAAVKRIDEVLKDLNDVKSSARHEAGTTSATVVNKNDELKKELLAKIASVDAYFDSRAKAADAAIVDIHRRIDTQISQEMTKLRLDVADVARRIENTVSGLSSQRVEWDQLKKEVRDLLLDVTRVITEMESIKHTLGDHSTKVDGMNDRVANLRAALDRLMRLETELERLKDEISRSKRG